MLEKAIAKIKSEMDQNKNNPYVQVVGGFLLQHLKEHPESAEKIAKPEKTIVKSLDEMKKAAEKKKVGNCAVLTDEEGFEIVLKYFGIEAVAVKYETPQAIPVTVPTPGAKPVNLEMDFDIKLEDLLS
jgi:hypothetical protein